ncbi:MAG: hypothetical protein HY011_33730 [Acidobacteria bacterium]|nr:hypothetical protein [Acidobacteriota bacterium]
MGIWLIVILWTLLAAIFVLAMCAAASRPIPTPENSNLIEQSSMNSKSTIRSPRAINACRAAALAVLLAVITTSCATNHTGYRTSGVSNEPVKGATLLMQH